MTTTTKIYCCHLTIFPITCRQNLTPRIIRIVLLLPRSETVLILVVPLYRSWTTGACSGQRRRAVLYDEYKDADADVKVAVVAVEVNNEMNVIKNCRSRLCRRRRTVR